MIYFQYGARGVNLLEKFINDDLVNGIIWDPRFSHKDLIEQRKKIFTKKMSCLFDPKFFYYEYETPVLKNLEKLDFNPTEKITRKYLNDQSKMSKYFDGLIQYQLQIDTDNIMAPSLRIETFDSVNSERQLNLLDNFNDFISQKNIEKNKCINLTIDEGAFNDTDKMNDFISSLDELREYFSDIYLTIIRNQESNNKLSFNQKCLENILNFIYFLNYIGYKVTVGYTGLEGILYFAVGATNIGTNISQSLKRLVIDKIGLTGKKNDQGGSQVKSHYTSIPLLNYLKCDLFLDQIRESDREKLFQLILSDSQLDNEIKAGKKSFEYTLIDTQYQYMEALHKFISSLENKSLKDRIDYVINSINLAIEKTNEYNELFQISNLPSNHLIEWKNALTSFKEKNIY